MPIYSYRCESCGHQQDILQKMSDPLLVTCPSCGQPAFKKQVTAAGFQLKGSGWYVTDFRDSAKGAKPADGSTGGKTSPAATESNPAPASAPASESPSTSSSDAPAPKAAPAPAGDPK